MLQHMGQHRWTPGQGSQVTTHLPGFCIMVSMGKMEASLSTGKASGEIRKEREA